MRSSLLSLFTLYSLLLGATGPLWLSGLPVLSPDCEAPFTYFYGNELDNFSGSTIATDGTFLYIGGSQNEKAIITKLRLDGQIVWTRSLELSAFVSQIIDLKIDRDGFLIGCGHTNPSSSLVDISSFAFKLDTGVGDVVWTQVYAEENSLFFLTSDILDRAAGEPYVLLGNAQHIGALNTGCDATFYTLNRNDGTLAGVDRHYTLGNCETFAAGVTVAGNVFTTGRFNASNTGFNRMRPAVVSMDGAGNPIMSRLFLADINNDARLFSSHIARVGTSQLVIAAHGDEDGTSVFSNDAWLLTMDLDGRAQDARKFTFPEPVQSEEVVPLLDGGYLLLTSAPGQNRLYLSRIDGLGQLQWSRSIEDVRVTPSGNEMVVMGNQIYLATTFLGTDQNRLALFRLQLDNGDPPLDCITYDSLALPITLQTAPYDGFTTISPYDATPLITNSMIVDFTDMEALDSSCLPDCEFGEICDNEEDDDGDGLTDCDDPDLADDCCCYTPPLLALGPDQRRCNGDSVVLELSAAYTTINWSTGDTTSMLTLTNSGTYSVTVSDACDNLQSDTIQLVIGQQVETNEIRQLCPGEATNVFGQLQNEAGDYTMTFPLANGCDSVHTVTVEFLAAVTTNEERTICQGESISVFGVMRTQAGRYSETFLGSNGCDSTHTVNLEVLAQVTSSEIQTICSGDSVLIFDVSRTEPGSYSNTFERAASNGCDSTHTVELRVLELVQTMETRTICLGDSTTIFGTFEQDPGSYTATFTGSNGCDSVHQVQVVVLEPVRTSETLPVQCAGSSLELFGQTVSESGTYQGTFVGSNGCDSVHQVRVQFAEPIIGRDTLIICSGEGVDVFGQFRSTPGDYAQTFMSSTGCDSLHITTLEEEEISTSFNVFPNCPSAGPGFIVFVRINGNGGPYRVSWNGRNFYNTTLQPVQPGEHVVEITSANGCIHEVPFTIEDPRESWWWALRRVPTCNDPQNGSITIAHDLPGLSYSLDGQSYSSDPTIERLAPGTYPIYLKYDGGCVLTDTLNIPSPKLPVVKLPVDRTIKAGESTRIIPLQDELPASTYRWYPDRSLDCKDCYKVIARPTKDTEYELKVRDAEGCENSDRIWIYVEEPQPYYVPNVFSPNRDGRNDYFTLFAGAEVKEIKELLIFDRWGEQLFSAENFPPNVEGKGWDGRFRARLMPPGTYAYFLRIELADGTIREVKGGVNLVR